MCRSHVLPCPARLDHRAIPGLCVALCLSVSRRPIGPFARPHRCVLEFGGCWRHAYHRTGIALKPMGVRAHQNRQSGDPDVIVADIDYVPIAMNGHLVSGTCAVTCGLFEADRDLVDRNVRQWHVLSRQFLFADRFPGNGEDRLAARSEGSVSPTLDLTVICGAPRPAW